MQLLILSRYMYEISIGEQYMRIFVIKTSGKVFESNNSEGIEIVKEI